MDWTFPIKLAVIAISTLIIFFQDIYIIGSDALASDYFNYVLIIPFLSFYLIYRKRRMLSAVLRLKDDGTRGYLNLALGFSGLTISLIVYLYGAYTSFPLDYHLIALQVFLLSRLLLFFNRQAVRIVAFPILLISTALPSAIQFGLGLWQGLSWSSAYVSFLILNRIGIHSVFTTISDAPTIQLTTASGSVFSFVVGVASSGAYSVVGFTLFAFFVAYIAKGSILRRGILFALGYPLLLLLNILRLVIIIGAAYDWGILAFNIFHFTSGIVLVFGVTLLLLALGEKVFKLQFFSLAQQKSACSYCSQEFGVGHSFCMNCGSFLRSAKTVFSRRDVLSLFTLLFAILIFMSTLEPAVATANTPSLVDLSSLTPQNVLLLLPQIHGWNLTFVARDTQIEEILQQDAASIFVYTDQNSSDGSNALITARCRFLHRYILLNHR